METQAITNLSPSELCSRKPSLLRCEWLNKGSRGLDSASREGKWARAQADQVMLLHGEPIVFDPTHPPFGDDWTCRLGPAAQTCSGSAPTEPPGRRRPIKACRSSLHSDATWTRRPAARPGEAGRQRWARPGRGWPDTNARATRTTRRVREGRRLQREQPPPKPKRVVPGGCEGTRQYAMKAWS